MSQACRDVLKQVNRSAGEHADLLLRRYLHVAAWADGHPEERRTLFDHAREACKAAARPAGVAPASAGIYGLAFARRADWLGALAHPACLPFELRTPPHQRLVTGLGGASPLETGLTLHHTYGVPVLPGSALKGLANHYWQHVAYATGSDPAIVTNAMFGGTDDAGYVCFHDAWIVPDSLTSKHEGLHHDVMTPHHGDYYAGAAYGTGELMPPTDFDDPSPISFLSVRGRFHFALTCEDHSDAGGALLARAKTLLIRALADWGIGGKTSSGYGRLEGEGALSAPMSSASNPTAITHQQQAPLPKKNAIIEVTILEGTTSRKKLRAKHEASGMVGSITNSDAVPADCIAGARLTVLVSMPGSINANLIYMNPEDKSRHKL